MDILTAKWATPLISCTVGYPRYRRSFKSWVNVYECIGFSNAHLLRDLVLSHMQTWFGWAVAFHIHSRRFCSFLGKWHVIIGRNFANYCKFRILKEHWQVYRKFVILEGGDKDCVERIHRSENSQSFACLGHHRFLSKHVGQCSISLQIHFSPNIGCIGKKIMRHQTKIDQMWL